MTSVLRFSLTERMEDGKSSSQIMDWRCFVGVCSRVSWCSDDVWGGTYFRVDYLQLPWTRLWLIGCTHQRNKRCAEQHLDYPPCTVVCNLRSAPHAPLRTKNGTFTHGVYPAIRITVRDVVSLSCAYRHTREVLVEICEQHVRVRSFHHWA